MARGTLGTGMMAPLQMANNFHGDYYAGPSGAAMGALMASQAIGDGFRDWGAAKGRRQDEAKVQAEMDRKRMDELNQRQAVASAINPMQAAESSGMGNRDMTRRMALPDANTQMGIYKMQEAKAAQEQEARNKQITSLATLWYANGGEKADPGGAKFQERFGVSPYEYVPQGVITSMANLDLRRDMADEGNLTRIALAQMAAAGRGGGGKLPSAPGYESFYDETGQVQMRPIPGGPADVKQQALESKRDGATAAAQAQANLMLEDIGTAKKIAKDYWLFPNAGWGSYVSGIKGTDAYDLDKTLTSIKARIGFDELQRMRQNSPTGGALGQVAVQELESLQSVLGSIDPGQSTDKLVANLGRLEDMYLDVVHGAGNWERAEDGKIRVAQGQGAPQQPVQSSSRQKVGPRPGTVIDGYEYLGGDPNNPGAWRPANGK